VKPLITKGIILSRTDFGEADRIVTMLTPDRGKLRLMVKGVRKLKSKLAGGIELFSVSDITYMEGKGEIGTLISARLIKYYSNIVKDIDRVQLGYELIKMLNRATEDQPEPEYFQILEEGFKSLDDAKISAELIKVWFQAQLLQLSGHAPNLATDTNNQKLDPAQKYVFDFDAMSFASGTGGRFTADHIKLLRLLFSPNTPKVLNQIEHLDKLLKACSPLVQTMLQNHIRI
jgi:DNA repair protein RecO (recombination protein O)